MQHILTIINKNSTDITLSVKNMHALFYLYQILFHNPVKISFYKVKMN
jgi:hypothetical protein